MPSTTRPPTLTQLGPLAVVLFHFTCFCPSSFSGCVVPPVRLRSGGQLSLSCVSFTTVRSRLRRSLLFFVALEQHGFVSSTLTMSQPCRWLSIAMIFPAGLHFGVVAWKYRIKCWVLHHVTLWTQVESEAIATSVSRRWSALRQVSICYPKAV